MLLECPNSTVICHKYFSSTALKELFYQGKWLLPSHLNKLLVNWMLLF